MLLWTSDNDALDLGDTMNALHAFGELETVCGDDYPELLSVPDHAEQDVEGDWLAAVQEQARACLEEHGDDLTEDTLYVLHQLTGQKQSESFDESKIKRDDHGRFSAGSAHHVAATLPTIAHAMPHQHVDPAKPGATAFGDDKILIGPLRDAYRKAHPGVSEEAFNKALLAARQDGLLTLSRADLADVMHPSDLKKSELQHGNSQAHYVRIPGAAAAEYARHSARVRGEPEVAQPAVPGKAGTPEPAPHGLSEREKHRSRAILDALHASLEAGVTPMGDPLDDASRAQIERRIKMLQAELP